MPTSLCDFRQGVGKSDNNGVSREGGPLGDHASADTGLGDVRPFWAISSKMCQMGAPLAQPIQFCRDAGAAGSGLVPQQRDRRAHASTLLIGSSQTSIDLHWLG